MAGLVACGDDSSSNSGDGKLPEKVPTLEKTLKLPCDETLKCEKVFVEEENINDYFQCDGERWQPITDPKFKDLCSTKEEGNNSEGTEEGSNNDGNSSDSEGNSSNSNDNSSDSAENNKPAEMVSCDNLPEEGQQAFGTMGEKCTEFEKGTSAATALELRCEDRGGTLGTGCPAKQEENNSSSSAEVTGPTGAVVSCLQEISMMGVTTQSCSEMAADSKDVEAMKASCQSQEGFLTATLGTGCPTTYTKKCVVDNENVAYFYEAANASEDCADLVQKN
jgi:hypothetical protein